MTRFTWFQKGENNPPSVETFIPSYSHRVSLAEIPSFGFCFSTERPRFWAWPMSKSTWPTSSCGFSMMNSRIPSLNNLLGIYPCVETIHKLQKNGGKIKQKVDQFVFLAKILTCAFPKLVIMIYLWFRKRCFFFAPGAFLSQHQMLHLLLLYPHLGCRIGPQRPQVISTNRPLAIHPVSCDPHTIHGTGIFTYMNGCFLW